MRYSFKVLGMWDGLFLKSLELIGFGVSWVGLKRGELLSELLLRRCAINSNIEENMGWLFKGIHRIIIENIKFNINIKNKNYEFYR